jgi:hypothetical protein
MMRVASLVVALVLPLTVFAQRLSHPVMVSRDDAFSSPAVRAAGTDTVRVLALMVQFVKDSDTRTTGDGRFDLSVSTTPALDSPPHNAAYFRSHLLFLENYYKKSSKGKLAVRTTLLDSVVTLPTTMGTYAPARGGSNLPVANLAVDAWRAADSLHLVSDFRAYDAFVVFHAGAGRDLDLVGEYGYDPTPLDIPSLYFGLNAFKGFYGTSYQGIPVNGGAFHITNSLVIPETETRNLPTVTGDVLYNLSTNGLLCSSLGNYLGLPDLFNTATGASGIGRFGLMDGQAIFSYSGAFPPEPSAWEKYWLGWINPVTVPPGTAALTVPAASISDTAYRIPISASEYFLVENRNRDPLRTGQTVTSVYNGATKQQTYARDTVGFDDYSNDFSALSGAVIDVTSLDWSLPGATDQDGTWYDGGILIWQIDETVIARTIAGDSVNANPARRGVNLREADGSQDIGQSYGMFNAGSGSEAGTLFDFWYQGNTATVYKNEFSPTSYPNSNSNSGANSHITVRSFSARGPRMTAVVERGDPAIIPLAGFPKSLGQKLPAQSLTVLPGSTPTLFVATLGTTTPGSQKNDSLPAILPARLYAWTANGTPALPGGGQSGVVASTQLNSAFSPGLAAGDLNNDGVVTSVLPIYTPTGPGQIRGLTLRDQNPVDTLADVRFGFAVPRAVTTPPLIADSTIVFGCAGGKAYFARLDGTVYDSVQTWSDTSQSVSGVGRFSGSAVIMTNTWGVLSIGKNSSLFSHQIPGPPASGDFNGTAAAAFATSDGLVYLVNGSFDALQGFPVNTGAGITVGSLALGDIDGDGSRDIVVFSGSKIFVYNRLGSSVDHFPVTVPGGGVLASNPIVADMNGDGKADIVGVTSDGLVAAYDRDGKILSGFPLAAGAGTAGTNSQSVAAFLTPGNRIGLVVASSTDGTVTGWTTGSVSSSAAWVAPWPQYQKDSRHSGFDGSTLTAGVPVTQEFFPANRSYNWPNPVYDGITHIRYYIKENATVRIRIFDLAGDMVTEMAGPGVGGMDNEVEWKVGSVQSGVYFARIEANGAGGSGVNIVKVAIVK